MLNFRRVTFADEPIIRKYFSETPRAQLNYCFEVLYLWRDVCEFEVCEYDGFLLIKTFIECNHNFLFPLGNGGNLKHVFELMKQYAESHYCTFNMFQINEEEKNWFEENMADRCSFEAVREEFEYVYLRERLATLSGKKLQAKRNHINALEKECSWSYEAISSENIQECCLVNSQWISEHTAGFDRQMEMENTALCNALADFSHLNIQGGALRINGRIEAFSLGCPLTDDTYLVLFEKANAHIRGAYPLMNREFIRHAVPEAFTFINRAEDAGEEGLRQAKLSYIPDRLEPLYKLTCTK